jgi:ribonuclease Y
MLYLAQSGTLGPLILVGAVGLVLGGVAVFLVGWMRTGSAMNRARQIEAGARGDADHIRKEAEITAKEQSLRRKEELEKEISTQRGEVRDQERRVAKREDSLEHKVDLLNKKEHYIESLERSLAEKRKEINTERAELENLMEQQKITLHKISGLSLDEARDLLMKRLEVDLQKECAELIARRTSEAKENAEREARKVLGIAIQRYAADQCAESVVAAVELPGDDMKGRIIGREGRNIRAFEKATGMDVVVDDTPGVVVISGFDGVRRELARRSMEKLVRDGRIHPARIEEVVEQTRKEMEQIIAETGKQAAFDVGIHNLHPLEIECLGRLKYRTSYGQNQLLHATEVAHLTGTMAAELGLDIQLAKRCGLLHDIGKSVDQEVEGSHPQIGAEMARKCGEPQEVIDAVAGHHDDVQAANIYVVLVAAADAISASRPGARRETLEKYIKRLQRLEEIAGAFTGVETAYAIRAGREVRVIVSADRIDDKMAAKTCRDIAKEIEAEMTYPGEVKVTLIRENRFVEVAH